MEIIKKDEDFWAYFWRVTDRQSNPKIKEHDEKMVNFLMEALKLEKGMKVLDLGSGSGEYTRLLAQRGIKCVGIEIAPSLVEYSKKRAKEEGISVEYIQSDMREIKFKEEFDCVTVIQIFGIFEDRENLNLLKKISHALIPNGRLLLVLINPYQRFHRPTRSWEKVPKYYLLMEDEFLPEISAVRLKPFIIDIEGGKILTQTPETVIMYTIPEVKAMFEKVGLVLSAVYGSIDLPFKRFISTSDQMIVIANKYNA